MSVTDQPEQRATMLLEEAMDWFMLLRDTPADPALMAAWGDWLQASETHAAAWTRICRTWAALGDRPAALPDVALQSTRPSPASQVSPIGLRLSSRSLRLAAACLMSAGLVVALFGPALQIRLEADFLTGAGETRIVTLADGSRVTLAPYTALADDVDGTARHVRLLAGEAFFEVERDATRPFVVDAQDASVRVLGTAFSVRDTGHGTRVELAHGSIALRPQGVENGTELTLAPGDVATVDRRGGKAELSRVDPADIALWREGRLSVTDQALGDVVALIQRQHPAWIMLPESDLATLRVTGLYDLSDPDRALTALAAAFGLQVRAASPYLRIVSSR
ncbi:FecR family protein [Rhizobium sp. 'Codium 1']|uniref:FecR family protein n=1 Tax=Rhizobium sp. 'Codium 1' TaxID=2940484 RepID=UPI001E2C3EB0|nr:FecR family protein [Rhizobium sp. 'Codium 1']MCC8934785.1 FecR family protein [Rhizobium sp. 'Codium 1']